MCSYYKEYRKNVIITLNNIVRRLNVVLVKQLGKKQRKKSPFRVKFMIRSISAIYVAHFTQLRLPKYERKIKFDNNIVQILKEIVSPNFFNIDHLY